jgi:hypothetical protein
MAVRHTSIKKLKVLSGVFLFQNRDNILTHLDEKSLTDINIKNIRSGKRVARA